MVIWVKNVQAEKRLEIQLVRQTEVYVLAKSFAYYFTNNSSKTLRIDLTINSFWKMLTHIAAMLRVVSF